MPDALLITCPKCGAELPLTEAVTHHLREQVMADFEKQRAGLSAAFAEREAKLAGEKTALEQRVKSVEAEVAVRLEAERRKILAEASRQAESTLATELQDLQTTVAEQRAKLQAARDGELALRREKQELGEAKAAMELEVARKLDEERQNIADHARQQAIEAGRLKLAERDHVIQGLREEIDTLQQRAGQGSIQVQGETLEIRLEADLRGAFHVDEISEVKKGERGADVAQRVRTSTGLDCGLILWEAKRARNWSNQWAEKLRGDQRSAAADLAVIVTTNPPDGIRGIGQWDGVWVCEPEFTLACAALLRQGLISTAAQRVQQADRGDKIAALYDHLCSVEFRHSIEAIVESFIGLKDQLDSEQRAFARQWTEREKQIQKALTHTARLYGGVQGIAGREALPEIPTLSLPLLSS